MATPKTKQSVRVYLDVDDYRELLKQAASCDPIRTPSDYACGLLTEALKAQSPDSPQ